jgi:hypothetical protein
MLRLLSCSPREINKQYAEVMPGNHRDKLFENAGGDLSIQNAGIVIQLRGLSFTKQEFYQ